MSKPIRDGNTWWAPMKSTPPAGRIATIRTQKSDAQITIAVSGLDEREILAVLGTTPVSGGRHLLVGGGSQIDMIAGVLARSHADVFLIGPRGGLKRFAGGSPSPRPSCIEARKRPSAIDVRSILAAVHSDTVDILAWHSRSRHSRFVSISALSPIGVASSRYSHLLVRAKQRDGRWIYAAIETISGAVDSAIPFGGSEGWEVRSRFDDAMSRIGLPVLENPPSKLLVSKIHRRQATMRLQQDLDAAGLSSVRVLEARHTFQLPGLFDGAAGQHLGSLANAIYGQRPSAGYCLVIDDALPATRIAAHANQLVAQSGNQDLLSALGITAARLPDTDEWQDLEVA